MYTFQNYLHRGSLYLKNTLFPTHKKLSTLMLYATDLCNSRCKHCLVWTKKPVRHLPFSTIAEIVKSPVVNKHTSIGLEGGEFLLHPEADEIMSFLDREHPNYDLLSNCVQPERTIKAIEKHNPLRLFISLDGTQETHKQMRGNDCYDKVLEVIRHVKEKIPVSVMFTLTPYNSFADMQHVCEVCLGENIDVRIGIYNNMPYFETVDKAHDVRTSVAEQFVPDIQSEDFLKNIPEIVRQFSENYDFIALYEPWRRGELQLSCNSIRDSIIILPDGSVPLCQNLSIPLGNVNETPLHKIINSAHTHQLHKSHKHNCNQCWINFHRKYDIILYRNLEKIGGRMLSRLMLGEYQWTKEKTVTYRKYFRNGQSF